MIIPNIVVGQRGKSMTEPYIQSHFPIFYDHLIKIYPDDISFQEKLYWFFNDIKTHPTCPECGNKLRFKSFGQGYRDFCSNKCSNGSKTKKSTIRQTCIERYGGPNPLSNADVRGQVEQTCIERYGGPRATCSPEIRAKSTQTCIERYGVPNPTKSDIIKQKIEQTCIERYGVPNPTMNREILEKSKNTCIAHYGAMGFASKEIRTKCIETARTNGSKCASKISQQFFEELDKYLPQYTTHYDSKNGEMVIDCGDRYYKADYLIEELGIIVEYNGGVWHADPTKFRATDHPNPYNPDLSAQDIWDRDNQRRHDLESLGYRVVVLWDREYKDKKFDISKFIKENIY